MSESRIKPMKRIARIFGSIVRENWDREGCVSCLNQDFQDGRMNRISLLELFCRNVLPYLPAHAIAILNVYVVFLVFVEYTYYLVFTVCFVPKCQQNLIPIVTNNA